MVDELLKMYYTLFNMLRWNTTTWSFYLTFIFFQYKITSIKSDTFNNITQLDRLSIFLVCCWHSMTCNTCSWRLNRFETLFNIYFTVICIPIYNHINKIRHVQQHDELFLLSIFLFLLLLLTFYDLEYMYMYNLCCLRIICANYSNTKTK
jgi:hypothetical protein